VRDLLHLYTFGWVVSRIQGGNQWNAEPEQNEMHVLAPLPEGFFLVGRVVRFSSEFGFSRQVLSISSSFDDLI
jgi:hypothetical protein